MFGTVMIGGLASGMALAALAFSVGGVAFLMGGLVCLTCGAGALVSISARDRA